MNDKSEGRCPIQFDHHGADHAAHWPEAFANLRQNSPRPWVERYGGFWMATRYSDILKIAQEVDAFSTAKTFDSETGEARGGVVIPSAPGHRAIPNEVDPPQWKVMRDLLNPLFGPRAAENRRQTARQIVTALLDDVIESGSIDFVKDLTSPLPGMVTMMVLGIPPAEWKRYAEPIHKLGFLDRSDPDFSKAATDLYIFQERVDEEVALRRKAPRDDLFSYLVQAEVDGRALTGQEIRDICTQILGGGVDTTTALTSGAILQLGRDRAVRQRLIEDRSLLPLAREEFLRFITPIHGLARTVARDVEIDGWSLCEGERIFLAYSSANRDPDIFEDPESLNIDRKINRHIAFGAGIHRCLGSFLARVMFEEMMNQVLDRMPDYELIEDGVRFYPTVGSVNGLINLPARFAPGKRIAA